MVKKFFLLPILFLFFLFSLTTTEALSFPKIKDIEILQLHKTYDELPHRYKLTAAIEDGIAPFKYSWRINCGSFVGTTNSPVVEWQYGKVGECADATVVLALTDSEGYGQALVQSVFDDSTRQITDIVSAKLTPSPTIAPQRSISPPYSAAVSFKPAFSLPGNIIVYILAAALILLIIASLFVLSRTKLVEEKCQNIQKNIDQLRGNLAELADKKKSLAEKIKAAMREIAKREKLKKEALKDLPAQEQNLKDAQNFLESARNELKKNQKALVKVERDLKKLFSERLLQKRNDLKEQIGNNLRLEKGYTEKLQKEEDGLDKTQDSITLIDRETREFSQDIERLNQEIADLTDKEAKTEETIEKEKQNYAACMKLTCVENEERWDEHYYTRVFYLPDPRKKVEVIFDTGPIEGNYVKTEDVDDILKFFSQCSLVLKLAEKVGKKIGLHGYTLTLTLTYARGVLSAASDIIAVAEKLRNKRTKVFESIRIMFPVIKATVDYTKLEICKNNQFVPQKDVRVIHEDLTEEEQWLNFPNRGDYIFSEEVPQILEVLKTHPLTLEENKHQYELFTHKTPGSSYFEKYKSL